MLPVSTRLSKCSYTNNVQCAFTHSEGPAGLKNDITIVLPLHLLPYPYSNTNTCFCLFPLLILCTIAIFQLYLRINVMYEMRRRKRELTTLPTQGIFNLPHHIGTVWKELAFDDAVSFTQQGNAHTCFSMERKYDYTLHDNLSYSLPTIILSGFI